VHAYLHRKEGEASNAGYWYLQAGKSHAQQTLETEWNDIAEAIICGVKIASPQVGCRNL
jgi:hypothetical protein